jgi:hypothetical protein
MTKCGNKAQKLKICGPRSKYFQNLAREQKSLATPGINFYENHQVLYIDIRY